jgi:hypothetical protein
MPSAINSSHQIFITFDPKSTFTENDAWNYFRYCCLTLVFAALAMKAYLLWLYATVNNIVLIFLPATMALSIMCKFHFRRNACLVM